MRYRSFFWPALLILVGIIALLINLGAIPVEKLYLLVNLWPLILIVLGLELIVRRSLHGVSGDVVTAAIVLVAILGAVAYVALSPNTSTTRSFDSATTVGTIEQASLEIDAGASHVTISEGTDLGADLYRAHVEYSGPKPEINFVRSTGDLTISQQAEAPFQSQSFGLTLQLNAKVPWKIALNSGASRDDITLGAPSGIVPVKLNGGALTVRLHRPSGTAVSVTVQGGAVNLQVDGKQATHAIGSASYSSPDFSGAADGYRIDINCGSCSVTLDSTG